MDDFKAFLSQQTFPLYVRIRVVPGAQKTEIIGLMDDKETWKVRIAAAPEKGKANKELVAFLHKAMMISAEVISGANDRIKLLKLGKIDN